jgi:putative endonuclease
MSTTERGRVAEKLAANYLEQRGFKILKRNWHNRFVEIDLVAEQRGTIHIVEVKYRARTDWGTGFESITHDKAMRLERAAQYWVQETGHTGPIQIDAIAVAGDLKRPIIDYIPNALG